MQDTTPFNYARECDTVWLPFETLISRLGIQYFRELQENWHFLTQHTSAVYMFGTLLAVSFETY